MASGNNPLSGLINNIASAIVMLVVSILSLFVTIFVVESAAGFAGYQPVGDYVVLSASILTGFAMLSGQKIKEE